LPTAYGGRDAVTDRPASRSRPRLPSATPERPTTAPGSAGGNGPVRPVPSGSAGFLVDVCLRPSGRTSSSRSARGRFACSSW